MSRMLFVNLPVKDLAAATRLFAAIGCEKNDQFSDQKAAAMAWSDSITFMLLKQDYFSTFISKPLADSRATVGALYALSCESRETVDSIVAAADRSGGRSDVRAPMDLGWMYNRAFEDADGHVFEAVWMDMAAAAGAGQASEPA